MIFDHFFFNSSVTNFKIGIHTQSEEGSRHLLFFFCLWNMFVSLSKTFLKELKKKNFRQEKNQKNLEPVSKYNEIIETALVLCAPAQFAAV